MNRMRDLFITGTDTGVGKTVIAAAILSNCRNAGIDAAKGDYAAFCDSDDIWVSDKLEIQVRRLMNLHCTLSCSDAFIMGSEGKRYLEHYRFRPWGLNNDLLWENFIIPSSVVIRRTTLGERRFTTDPVFRGYEDYLLWLALRETLAIDFVNEPLCGYRKHAASISAENRHRDARQQLRIMASQAAFLRHPLIALRKTARYIYHALR
jgi:hypothetical protein